MNKNVLKDAQKFLINRVSVSKLIAARLMVIKDNFAFC